MDFLLADEFRYDKETVVVSERHLDVAVGAFPDLLEIRVVLAVLPGDQFVFALAVQRQ